MKFVCDRCQTKYAIADDRVRGKVLKVKCKTCANLITVREARRSPSEGVPAVSPAAAHADSGPQQAERTILAPQPPPEPSPPLRRETVPLVAGGSAALDDGVQWYMALDGQRTGPFTRRQLVDKVVALPRDADLHVWSDRLDGWKAPTDVPAIAAEIIARRRPVPPPPPPGAPKRGTPPPPPPLGAPRRPTPHPAASAVGAALGIKLPPPGSAGVGRPPTPVGSPIVGGGPGSPAAHPLAARGEADASSLLETPAPVPAMYHGLGGTNGVGGVGAHKAADSGAAAPPLGGHSDVLGMLNLAPSGAAAVKGAAPRVMSSAAAVGWEPSLDAPASRSRNAKLIFALLGVVAAICVVLVFSVRGKSTPPPPPPAKPAADPIASLAEKVADQAPPPPVAPAPAPAPAPSPAKAGGKRGSRPARPSATSSNAAAAAAAPGDANTDKYRDTTRPNITVAGAGASSRPPPSQSEISKVVNNPNNRAGIKNCYQRALLRDNSLTHGKIAVKVTIGISGRVKHVSLNGPQQFRAVEPCIRDVVSRWAFPQSPDEYATEFVTVFQGNE